MAYGYWYNQTGFNGLHDCACPAPRGFGERGSSQSDYEAARMLPRGSRLRWSGQVYAAAYNIWTFDRESELKALLESYGFKFENFTHDLVSRGWDLSDYKIGFTVTTPVDYGNAEDAFSVLTRFVADIYNTWPRNISPSIVNVPYRDPQTGQPIFHEAPIVKQPGDSALKDKGNPSNCNWDTQTIGEYLACQLGFNSTSTATIVVIGALVLIGIVALKK